MPKKSLLVLFLITLVDLLGLGIVIPLFTPLIVGPESILPLLSHKTQSITLGFLMAAYPAAQFFGAPILGSLADKYGRKPILLVSLLGSLLWWILFCFGVTAEAFALIVCARLLSGFTGGNMAVVYSATADITTKSEDRMRNFGLIGLAGGIGFIVGPFLGGVLARIPVLGRENILPFLLVVAITCCNILLTIFFFRETIHTKSQHPINLFSGVKSIRRAFDLPHLREILLVTFIYTCGFVFFAQFFQLFMQEKFGVSEADIGLLFGYTGIWIAITQGILIAPISRLLGTKKTLAFSLILSGIAILAGLGAWETWMFYVIIPFLAMGNGLFMPSASTITSELARDHQGEIFGINQALQALSESVPPIISGFLAAFWVGLPLVIASCFIFGAWIVFWVFFLRKT